MDNNKVSCCQNAHASSGSTFQTLTEMEFERGIWTAALEGDLDKTRDLIRKNPDCVHARDSSEYTGLHYASRAGYLDVIRLLLDAGADVNALTGAGKVTPLHRAAYMGHLEGVKLLIARKGDPHLRDSDGKNALDKAKEKKNNPKCQKCAIYLTENFPNLVEEKQTDS